jgi:hypothetical protein
VIAYTTGARSTPTPSDLPRVFLSEPWTLTSHRSNNPVSTHFHARPLPSHVHHHGLTVSSVSNTHRKGECGGARRRAPTTGDQRRWVGEWRMEVDRFSPTHTPSPHTTLASFVLIC